MCGVTAQKWHTAGNGVILSRMKKLDADTFKLESGRTFSANCGIIGIDEDEGKFTVHEGYDGGISGADMPATPLYGDDETVWTWEEKLELADYMVDLWKRYSVRVRQGK